MSQRLKSAHCDSTAGGSLYQLASAMRHAGPINTPLCVQAHRCEKRKEEKRREEKRREEKRREEKRKEEKRKEKKKREKDYTFRRQMNEERL